MRPKSPNYYQKNIMVKRILLSIVLLLVIAYLVVAVTAFNRKPTSQVCQDVELVIKDTVYAGFITKKEVATLLEKKGISPIGKDLERVRTKTLERELAKHPLIDQVECYKTPSGKLCIEVTQRTPILRVMSANGENYYLDNKGTVMPPDAKCVAHLAVVTGNVEKSFAMRDLYKFWCIFAKEFFLECTDRANSRIARQEHRVSAPCRRPSYLFRQDCRIREEAETCKGILRKRIEPGGLEQILPYQR